MPVTSPKAQSMLIAREEQDNRDGKVSPDIDVFEGPEKKLEMYFQPSDPGQRTLDQTKSHLHADGFRHFSESTWSDVLADAHCSILHAVGNDHFDAYLLSESSLFVYPTKVILKTCGTTTLLLVLPKVLALADELSMPLLNVHYSHFRYAFPQLQPYPHSSFGEEQRTMRQLLKGRVHDVSATTIGKDVASGTAWFALCADGLDGNTCGPWREDCIFEVAMEGLSREVCDNFFGTASTHGGQTGRNLALSMSSVSGVAALVAGATVDDWAFEPCGYSMNALRGPYYYTVHVTPEYASSYASFETNDPNFVTNCKLNAIANTFDASSLTVTVTTRGSSTGTPLAAVAHAMSMSSYATCQITNEVTIRVSSFERARTGSKNSKTTLKTAAIQAATAASADGGSISSDEEQSSHAGSWADSELTFPLDETRSEGDEFIDSPPAKRSKSVFEARDEDRTDGRPPPMRV